MEYEVFENERYLPVVGWKSRMVADRKRYSLDSKGVRQYNHFPNIGLPRGWEWKGPWKLDKDQYVDPEGWAYATDFSLITWPPKPGSEKYHVFTNSRQRRWVRKSGRIASFPHRDSMEKCDMLGVCPAGKALPLPKSRSRMKTVLQVRPVIGDSTHHDWSEILSSETARLYISDLTNGKFYISLFSSIV